MRYAVQPRLWADTAYSMATGPYFGWQAKRVNLSDYVSSALAESAMGLPEIAALAARSPMFAPIGLAASLGTLPRLKHRRGSDRLDLGDSRADIGKALGIPESVIKSF